MSIAIIVAGGRDMTDYKRVFAALDTLSKKDRIDAIVTSGDKGCESFACAWAKIENVALFEYRPDNDDMLEHGENFGRINNDRMLEKLREIPVEKRGVVAFPGGPWTDDMVQAAEDEAIKAWWPFGCE